MIPVLRSLLLLLCLVASAYAQQEEGATADNTKELRAASEPTGEATAQGAGGEEDKSAPTDAEQRERGADEDPLSASDAKRDVQRKKEEKGEPERSTGFDIYGSLRIRYREQGGETAWEDGSSRIGIEVDWQFLQRSFLFARYEVGFNVLSALNPNESIEEFKDDVFTRLFHVGLDTPSTNIIVGKNWSTYYEVGFFTDRFMGTGGNASGTYNAQTDGGPTGPGRADRTLQTKLSLDFLPHKVFKPFKLNVQVQNGNPIPFSGGADYGTAVGISSVMTTQNNFTLGVAYNHADIDIDNNPSLRDVGISGDARALLIGARAFGERWYAGLVLARMENHETTDEGIYFDGWGSEFYGQYQVSNRWWFVGGYNILEPDSDQVQAGDYRIRYAVAGLRYTFDDFRRMIFANVRLDNGVDANGTPGGNIYTIGVRWDMSKTGWHASN